MKNLIVSLSIVAALAGTTELQAQTCTANPCSVGNTVSVTVPVLTSLSLSSATAALTAPVLGDFTAGVATITEGSGPSLTVKSNKIYSLTVASAVNNFTPGLGASGYNKPSTDLEVKHGTGSFFGLSTTAATLVANGAKTSSTVSGLIYRTTYNFTSDTPDSYSLVVNYTLSAP